MKIRNSQFKNWVLSVCFQGLQNLPPNVSAQKLLVSEIWRLFFKKRFKELDIECFKIFKLPTL